MGIFSNLFSRIAISSNRKITASNVDNCVIKCVSHSIDNKEGISSIRLNLSVDSEKINFDIGDKNVNKVAFLFDVILNNCTYNEQEGWLWNDEYGYRVEAGKKTPNIIVYSEDIAMNGKDTGKDYTEGLKQTDDKSLGYQTPLMMIAKTPSEKRIDAFKGILKNLNLEQKLAYAE